MHAMRLGIAAAPMLDWRLRRFSYSMSPSTAWIPRAWSGLRNYLPCALAAEGRVVLVSSHLMSELQDTADRLVVVGRGVAIADTSVAALIPRLPSGDRIQLRTTAPGQAKDLLSAAGATVAATAPDVVITNGISSERLLALLS